MMLEISLPGFEIRLLALEGPDPWWEGSDPGREGSDPGGEEPAPSPSPVTAVMHTTPEMSVPALVMNCLVPSIVHSPSRNRARVRVLPASEPASGSVSPNAPSISPEHSRGSHSRFCSCEPNR